MLGSTDVDSTAGKYMFKKVSREILNLIGELSQFFLPAMHRAFQIN